MHEGDSVDQPERAARSVWRGLEVGYMLLAAVLVGLGLGYLLDSWLGTSPWGLIVLTLLSITSGLYHVVKEYWPQ